MTALRDWLVGLEGSHELEYWWGVKIYMPKSFPLFRHEHAKFHVSKGFYFFHDFFFLISGERITFPQDNGYS